MRVEYGYCWFSDPFCTFNTWLFFVCIVVCRFFCFFGLLKFWVIWQVALAANPITRSIFKHLKQNSPAQMAPADSFQAVIKSAASAAPQNPWSLQKLARQICIQMTHLAKGIRYLAEARTSGTVLGPRKNKNVSTPIWFCLIVWSDGSSVRPNQWKPLCNFGCLSPGRGWWHNHPK